MDVNLSVTPSTTYDTLFSDALLDFDFITSAPVDYNKANIVYFNAFVVGKDGSNNDLKKSFCFEIPVDGTGKGTLASGDHMFTINNTGVGYASVTTATGKIYYTAST